MNHSRPLEDDMPEELRILLEKREAERRSTPTATETGDEAAEEAKQSCDEQSYQSDERRSGTDRRGDARLP